MKVELRKAALASVLEGAKREVENFEWEFLRARSSFIAFAMAREPEALPAIVNLAGIIAARKAAQRLVSQMEEALTRTMDASPDTLVDLELDFDITSADWVGDELSLD